MLIRIHPSKVNMDAKKTATRLTGFKGRKHGKCMKMRRKAPIIVRFFKYTPSNATPVTFFLYCENLWASMQVASSPDLDGPRTAVSLCAARIPAVLVGLPMSPRSRRHQAWKKTNSQTCVNMTHMHTHNVEYYPRCCGRCC